MIKLFYKKMIQLNIIKACFDQTLFSSNKEHNRLLFTMKSNSLEKERACTFILQALSIAELCSSDVTHDKSVFRQCRHSYQVVA
ncbi:hypothetical protein FZC66_05730 [Priestia megaterium]|nr:hypothetical protein FZC66_05730 [Priestia megaterium]